MMKFVSIFALYVDFAEREKIDISDVTVLFHPVIALVKIHCKFLINSGIAAGPD